MWKVILGIVAVIALAIGVGSLPLAIRVLPVTEQPR